MLWLIGVGPQLVGFMMVVRKDIISALVKRKGQKSSYIICRRHQPPQQYPDQIED